MRVWVDRNLPAFVPSEPPARNPIRRIGDEHISARPQVGQFEAVAVDKDDRVV